MGHTITSLAQLETGKQKWALNLLLHMMHTVSGWSTVFVCNSRKKCCQILEKKCITSIMPYKILICIIKNF
jgi:hypothetical protein